MPIILDDIAILNLRRYLRNPVSLRNRVSGPQFIVTREQVSFAKKQELAIPNSPLPKSEIASFHSQLTFLVYFKIEVQP